MAAVLTSGEEADVTWFKGIESRVLAMARDIANPNQDADPYDHLFFFFLCLTNIAMLLPPPLQVLCNLSVQERLVCGPLVGTGPIPHRRRSQH